MSNFTKINIRIELLQLVRQKAIDSHLSATKYIELAIYEKLKRDK